MLIPSGSEHGSDSRLANFAAPSFAKCLNQLVEAANPVDSQQMIELLAGIGEVLAEVILHRHTGFLHLSLEEIRHQGHATAATRAGFRAFLDAGYVGEAVLANC